MARQTRQFGLMLVPPRRWGGARVRAGRKPNGERPGISHSTRPSFVARHPAHVTLRVRPDVPSLRAPKLVRAFEQSLAAASERGEFRLAHYSLQTNHVHLLVEAADRKALARGMKSVGSRLARAVNRVFRRVGPVLADRYHLRMLQSPREVRNALRYVLLNARKHLGPSRERDHLDPASSARWFDGWTANLEPVDGPRAVARARTWLLRVGWRRHGLIDPEDVPG